MEDLLKWCATYYQFGGEHAPEHSSYASFCRETHQQWYELPADVEFTTDNPYATAEKLFADCKSNQFSVFTEGAEFADGHPLANGLRNLHFRAVHDLYGHYGGHDQPHYDFSIEGELRAWLRHESMYSEDSRAALFCETVLQLAVYAVTGDFVTVQKCVIAPDSLIADVRAYVTANLI